MTRRQVVILNTLLRSFIDYLSFSWSLGAQLPKPKAKTYAKGFNHISQNALLSFFPIYNDPHECSCNGHDYPMNNAHTYIQRHCLRVWLRMFYEHTLYSLQLLRRPKFFFFLLCTHLKNAPTPNTYKFITSREREKERERAHLDHNCKLICALEASFEPMDY